MKTDQEKEKSPVVEKPIIIQNDEPQLTAIAGDLPKSEQGESEGERIEALSSSHKELVEVVKEYIRLEDMTMTASRHATEEDLDKLIDAENKMKQALSRAEALLKKE